MRAVVSPHRLRVAALVAAACALLLAVAGCGGDEAASDGALDGTRLTIYSSMPLAGPERDAAVDVVRAQRLALRDAGSRIGGYEVDVVSLDASTPKEQRWDPAQISDNARRAAGDPTAIAYLGEFHFGSSGISIPLLNEVGLLTVSPLDTAMGLTTTNVAIPDSPRKYYPRLAETGRTFARVVPSDRAQVTAQLQYMAREGVRRLVVLTDDDPLGIGFEELLRERAAAHGVTVVGELAVDPREQEPRDLVAETVALRPDAVFYAGAAHDGIVRAWQELAAADARLKLFAPGNVVDAPFAGAIGPRAARATYLTRAVLPLESYPRRARRVARRFERIYGYPPAPEALYGYEAASAVLAAIHRATSTIGQRRLRRADVVREFFATARRDSVLGPYEINPNGDTSVRRFGAYRLTATGRLRFAGVLSG